MFSSKMEYGISKDINGSYNAAQHNFLPLRPLFNKAQKQFINDFGERNVMVSTCDKDADMEKFIRKY